MKYIKGSAFLHFSWPGQEGLSTVLIDLIKMHVPLHISLCSGSPGACVCAKDLGGELPASLSACGGLNCAFPSRF